MLPLLVASAATVLFVVGVVGARVMRAEPSFGLLPDDVVQATVVPGGRRRGLVGRAYLGLSHQLGPTLLGVLSDRWRERTAERLATAGRPQGLTVATFAGRKAAFTMLGSLAGLALLLRGNLVLAVLMVVASFFYLDLWLSTLARHRLAQIEAELPDFLDVLAVTVSAGLAFQSALHRVAATATGPLADEIHYTLHRMEIGVRRREAFAELRERNPGSETVGLFVTAILQSEELGAPLTATLMDLSRDMRRQYAQDVRRRAARAVPRVSFIITIVILPAIVILLVMTLYIGSDLSVGTLRGEP